MSRASKHLAKEKTKIKKQIQKYNYHIACPNCGMEIPTQAFLKIDYGTNYKCPVCGKICYEEWVKEKFNEKEEE